MFNIQALDYKNHITNKHYFMTGSDLVNKKIGCPICKSILVVKNGRYGSFVGCGSFRDNGCLFTIKLNETLLNKSQKVLKKYKLKKEVHTWKLSYHC